MTVTKRSKSRRIKRGRNDPVAKLARLITTEAQVANGKFILCDIANHADADQRHMVRSGERQTIRRRPKIDELVIRGVLDRREAAACEWYLSAHAMRYDTVGITARYGVTASAGTTNFDHLPKNAAQELAFRHFTTARASISPMLLPMFERVVLHGRPLGKLAISFRTAARQLLACVEGFAEL